MNKYGNAKSSSSKASASFDETHIDDDDDDNDNSIIAEHNESSLIGEASVSAVISCHLSHQLYLLLILAYICYTFLPLI